MTLQEIKQYLRTKTDYFMPKKKQTNHIRDNVYINLDLSGKKIKNKNKHIGIIGHLINTKFIDRLSQNRRTSNDLFHPTHPERRNFCVVVLIST